MARRPIAQLRDLPRGTGGSHRRAAIEMSRRGELFTWIKNYSKRALDRPSRFRAPKLDSILAIPASSQPEIRLALFGDWGTGTDESARIAAMIKDRDPHYTIHLGDVYYVGSREFIAENCRGIRGANGYDPVEFPTGRIRSFAMNGNHEAYARDGAYFYWISKYLNQPSSCFSLYNDHWCIVALDTGYNSEGIPWLGWFGESLSWKWLMPSCKLPDSAIRWLQHDMQPYLTTTRGLIVLTHHQPCSAFDNEYLHPAKQLAGVAGFADRSILWFWGHEHRFAAYQNLQVEGLTACGRCIGHGGMPVDRGVEPKPNGRPLLFYDDRSYDPRTKNIIRPATRFGVNGYAMLTLEGSIAKATYRDISGEEIASEQWQVDSRGNVSLRGDVAFGPVVRKQGRRLVMADPARPDSTGLADESVFPST